MPTLDEINKTIGDRFHAHMTTEDILTIEMLGTSRAVDFTFDEKDMPIDEFKIRCLVPAVAALTNK